MSDTHALEAREGLPEALRILVNEYPRNIWKSHDHFDGLVRFWLERHAMFRKLIGMLIEDSNAFDTQNLELSSFQPRLHRYGSLFINELHTHHHIEDHQYFPLLISMETSLQRGFEILDKDHHALDDHLKAFSKDANALLQPATAKKSESIDKFQHRLEAMQGFLNRHLIDEEELVVPIILKHGFRG